MRELDSLTQNFRPEILSPAGSFEKLKVAMNYGADACYLAGQNFGLRSAADNFSLDQLDQASQFAHAKNKKIYVVLNSYLHDQDFEGLGPFLGHLQEIGVDALIISDLGVLEYVRKTVELPIHLSTQASCLNRESGKFWRSRGVKRLILGREVSIRDAGLIKRATGLEVELFIGGSMCMAYSGNCVISNYTQGRDSNRGGCAHSCRFEYNLKFDNGHEEKAFFMSSKDLEGIAEIPLFFEEKIDSLKIEGRMKGPLYAGSTARVYRQAVDHFAMKGKLEPSSYKEEIARVVHREYCNGSLVDPAGSDSVYNERLHNGAISDYQAVGTVAAVRPGKHIIVKVTKAFPLGSELEFIPFEGQVQKVSAHQIEDVIGRQIEQVKPNTLVCVPYKENIKVDNLVRQRVVP